MRDQFLAFIVVIAPTIFAIGVEVIDDRTRTHPYWRRGVIAFGLFLSGLTWWQIANEAVARENAIRETSQQVAAETSKQVTKAVSEQYKESTAGLYAQIGTLQSQLATQAKDVSLIKGSDIVTGKKPVKVEVTNQSSPNSPAPPLPGLNWTQAQESSENGKARVLVTLRVEDDLKIPAFLALCDRACETKEASTAGASEFHGLEIKSNPMAAGFVFTYPRPLTPILPVEWRILSKDAQPVHIQKIRIVPQSELPEEYK